MDKDRINEDKIYQAIRAKYGYTQEGDDLVDWLIEVLARGD